MNKEAENTLKRIEEDLRQIETESVKYIDSVSLHESTAASSLTQQMNEEQTEIKKPHQVQLDKKIKELENIKKRYRSSIQTFDSFMEVGVGDNLY
jgi:hypothetical protein